MAERLRAGTMAAVIAVLLGTGFPGSISVPRAFAAERAGGAAANPPAAPQEIEQKSAERDDLPSLAEVLGAEDDEALATTTQRCLDTRRIRTHRAIDDQHLVFQMRGGENLLVEFPRRCQGLQRGGTLKYQSTSGRLCRADSIRVLMNRGFGGFDAGPPCIISGFQPITPEQLDYLKIALERERKKKRRR